MQPDPATDVREGTGGSRGLGAAAAPRILLVEDDEAVRSSLKFAMELDGFEVEEFESAEAAASGARIDANSCLVFDYRLPGMDGLALLRLLRAQGIRAPAIIITSNPPRKLRQAIADTGATLIEKPLLCDRLTASVREKLA